MVKNELENLARVKFALAVKYERLARIVHSKPRKAVLFRQSERFRRQADDTLALIEREHGCMAVMA